MVSYLWNKQILFVNNSNYRNTKKITVDFSIFLTIIWAHIDQGMPTAIPNTDVAPSTTIESIFLHPVDEAEMSNMFKKSINQNQVLQRVFPGN